MLEVSPAWVIMSRTSWTREACSSAMGAASDFSAPLRLQERDLEVRAFAQGQTRVGELEVLAVAAVDLREFDEGLVHAAADIGQLAVQDACALAHAGEQPLVRGQGLQELLQGPLVGVAVELHGREPDACVHSGDHEIEQDSDGKGKGEAADGQLGSDLHFSAKMSMIAHNISTHGDNLKQKNQVIVGSLQQF